MPKYKNVQNIKKIDFSRKDTPYDLPNLIKVQLQSYKWFLQADKSPEERRRIGLHEIFLDIFPIQDVMQNLILEYVDYSLGLAPCKKCPAIAEGDTCKYEFCNFKEKKCEIAYIDDTPFRVKLSEEDCKKKDQTFGVPLTLRVRLINRQTGEMKDSDIFLVNLPIMTNRGTFIVNGAERVVVSQLHRSPGVYFEQDKTKKTVSATIIPYRGAWIEFEVDILKEIIYVRLDRKRKQHVSVFLRALGLRNDADIAELFQNSPYIKNTLAVDKVKDTTGALKEIYVKMRQGEGFTEEIARNFLHSLFFNPRRYDLANVGRYKLSRKLRLRDRITGRLAGESVYTSGNGELVIEPKEIISNRLAHDIERANVPSIKLITSDGDIITVFNEKDWEYFYFRKAAYFSKNVMLGNEVVFPEGTVVTEEIVESLVDNGITTARVNVCYQNINDDYGDIETEQLRKYVKEYDDFNRENEEEIRKMLLGRVLAEQITGESEEAVEKNEEISLLNVDDVLSCGKNKVKVLKAGVLAKDDIVAVIRYLIDLCNGFGSVDDIDHLGNRRIRRSGELLQNQFRMALARLERDIRDKMTIQEANAITPQNLINTRSIAAMVNDFFGSSQLSQFMDQTNPLSELTHKRKVSALGPGGVKRERAGYEVRDVHPSHFGRICPIETPEGPNAGLISSLSVLSRINRYGFLETPLIPIKNKTVKRDELMYLDAYEEDEYRVVPSDLKVDEEGRILQEVVPVKHLTDYGHEFSFMNINQIDYARVAPEQMVSIAAALIPFLEHDDANRALMGTNMQRQAVPLLYTDSPYVGTGLEARAAQDSRAVISARAKGIVSYVDAKTVIVKCTEEFEIVPVKKRNPYLIGKTIAEEVKNKKNKTVVEKDTKVTEEVLKTIIDSGAPEVKAYIFHVYKLSIFTRSNQGTCVHQKPIVHEGQIVEEGQTLADGAATSNGELALGKNVLVAFMPWEGYNYEDAILLSEKLVKEDIYTSVHIEVHEVEARETSLGPEEITRDIPNISKEAVKNLDAEGIIRIGADVVPGDILVGKVTPKGEVELSAEDKLLRAIFGEKAREVRNTSYVVPHGESGKIIHVNVFSREDKDELPHDVNKLVVVYIVQKRKILEGDKMAGRHGNKGVIARIMPEEDMPHLADGTPCEIVLNPLGVPSRMNLGQIFETNLGWLGHALGYHIEVPIFNSAREDEVYQSVMISHALMFKRIKLRESRVGKPVAEIILRHVDTKEVSELIVKKSFDEIMATIISKGNAYIFEPSKRKLVAKITDDYKKCLEAVKKGDFSKAADFFDEIPLNEKEILDYIVEGEKISKDAKQVSTMLSKKVSSFYSKEELAEFKKVISDVTVAKFEDGQEILFDGRTGRPLENKVTVGYIYMMKLAHLVDDKIHARATGPYSLVTQQPLGGKAQFGGQRFGEMEVWALEAYGAAYTLQELLTVKSDDVEGRVQVYEAIIKGKNIISSHVPEAFKVLVSELQSIGLKISLKNVDAE